MSGSAGPAGQPIHSLKKPRAACGEEPRSGRDEQTKRLFGTFGMTHVNKLVNILRGTFSSIETRRSVRHNEDKWHTHLISAERIT